MAAAAYYNEIDPDAALILRELIADGVIAPGEIDTRSITEVQPDDLRGFTQCHFFAGGGLWSVAARMSGWGDDRPIWTASCPCQPFSVAGKGAGTDDVRHLWPDILRLVGACRPSVLVGEQVAGKAGYGWLDGVRADLAGERYASRGVDIPACAVDAPHIRQRLYWVALADAEGIERRSEGLSKPELRSGRPAPAGADASGVTLGDAFGSRLEGQCGHDDDAGGRAVEGRPATEADGGELADAGSGRVRDSGRSPAARQASSLCGEVREQRVRVDDRSNDDGRGRNGSFWSDHDWLICHDGKARRTQSGIPLLVDGLPGRVALWRVAGNAISPVLAAEVIGALMDMLDAERLAA